MEEEEGEDDLQSKSIQKFNRSMRSKGLLNKMLPNVLMTQGCPQQSGKVMMGTWVLRRKEAEGRKNKGNIICVCLTSEVLGNSSLLLKTGHLGASVEDVTKEDKENRLRRGDIILAVNGTSLAGIEANEAQNILKRQEGLINLIFLRENFGGPYVRTKEDS